MHTASSAVLQLPGDFAPCASRLMLTLAVRGILQSCPNLSIPLPVVLSKALSALQLDHTSQLPLLHSQE